ncbi:MAG: substrate-binding domain-containing protein, partial [Bacillota bacterium]
FERVKALHPERQWETISGNDYLQQLAHALQSRKVRTALLCSGDIYALHIMRYFKQNAIKTPQDIGIMGFDNINILEYIVPHLTTVSTNVEQVATVAVNELLSQITDGISMPKRIVLPHTVMDMDTL